MTLEDSLSPFKAITTLDVLAFLVPFVVAVGIDLLTHKKGQKITMGNALKWSLVWIACAAAFAGYVWWSFENNPRTENFGGVMRTLDGSGAVSLVFRGNVDSARHREPQSPLTGQHRRVGNDGVRQVTNGGVAE